MDAHFVGQGQFSGGEEPSTHGNSLAMVQFMELARGEREVQEPRNPFRVEAVKAEERYCLGCCGVRWFDVVMGFMGQGSGVTCQVGAIHELPVQMLAMCRSCREMEER